MFSKPEVEIEYGIALFNSKVSSELLKVLSPTLDFSQGPVSNVPFAFDNQVQIQCSPLVQSCIDISKEDWDARETSWDFRQSELLRHKTDHSSLKTAVEAYETHWRARFTQLHRNEEELNRIFIDLYGLQDELTPDVDPADITILGPEATATRDAHTGAPLLHFDRRELMAQFVSYAVGCMFGRYSLSRPGLILASQGQTLDDYTRLTTPDPAAPMQHSSLIAHHSFLPDADNIIPVLDEDWFADDIVARFRAFVAAAFPGTDREFAQNMAFVEECLGMDIRKWFTRYFYDDHVRRYRRRPIYWLFRSPKGAFSALIYLHRYTPDTVPRLLNGYLREYGDKLRNRRDTLMAYSLSAGITAGEKNRAIREAERIEKMVAEVTTYEREVMYPLATEPLPLDLDAGVLVNYNKFGAALATVKGLKE